jgi:hypothetical protein
MKNLLIAALAVFSIGASAQDVNFKSKRGEYMLPEKGDWALGFSTDGIFEYVGNAFNGNTGNNAPTVSYTKDRTGSFVGKYFTSDKAAYRVVFNLKSIGTGTKYSNTTGDDTVIINPLPPDPNVNTVINTSNDLSESSTEFSIGLGKEWRRGKTRLQGFYGADFLLLFSSSSLKDNTVSETLTTVTTPAQTIKRIIKTDIDTKFSTGFGIGAEAFIGAEYFLFPKIAIGAQYTYSARYISTGAKSITTVVDDSTSNSTATPAFTSTITTTVNNDVNFPSRYDRGLSGVNVVSINLTLHF